MIERFTELRERAEADWAGWEHPQRPRIEVAIDTSSLAHGAVPLREALEAGARERGAAVDFGRVAGVGLQWLHPTVSIRWPDGTHVLYGPAGADDVPALLDEASGRVGAAALLAIGTLSGSRPGVPPVGDHPFFAPETERLLLARLGHTDPESLDHYLATGGYFAFARMLDRHQTADGVRSLLLDSGLTGRGGAYVPAGSKWNFLAGPSGPKSLICNADEGDPGAWVNRVLLESDPHLLIEGMLIAAHATGAVHGYIYIRDEYPLAVARVRQALEQAEQAGLLGEGILGSDLAFTLEVIRGAGAYVCGEETGLIASVHDERGMPRLKPPFPANPGGGVFGQPSNVNNVETYANVPLVLGGGAERYRMQGTAPEVMALAMAPESRAGTRMLSLSGDVRRVGFLEVPWGTPLPDLLAACGGMADGGRLKAIQAGGPLSGYLPGRLLDELVLDRESFLPHGAMVGSGGIVFVGADSCSVDLNELFADFLEDESCGRCTTCHGGTQRMTEIFRRTSAGGGRREDEHGLELIGDLLRYSNCVHGTASPTIMRNTLDLFRDEYEAHIDGAGCEALRCVGFTRFRVVDPSDPRLAAAQAICPTDAIERDEDGGYRVVDGACIRCGACADIAPRGIAREAAPPNTPAPAPRPAPPPGSLAR